MPARYRNQSGRRFLSMPPSRLVRRSSFHCSSSSFHSCRSFCSKRRKDACSARWHGPRRLAVGSSSILAITLVPVLMVMLIRGRLRPERANPISRITQAIYLPILRFCLRHRWLTIAVNLIFLIVTFPLASRLGSQFMPPLFEGSTLYMPTALPGISIEQAKVLLQQQDRVLRSFPEVASVFGAVGRSDSATDNAPLDMYDTTVMLKPREQWPAGMTYEKLIQEMDEKLQFPGLSNTWTMPGREPPGHGTDRHQDTAGHEGAGAECGRHSATGFADSELFSLDLPQVRSVFSEKVAQGFYVNVDVNREEAARYGLTIADVQTAVSSGIGGQNIAENIEGRERYPINVRYQRDFRDNVEKMRGVLIGTPSGAQIPLGQVARISFSHGPAMIRDEDGALTGYIYIDLKNTDYGGFVAKADKLLHDKLALPANYTFQWSGEYELELRAKQRLQLILPVVFFVIFLLLYLVFHSVAEALVLIFPTIYAMSGGLLLQWLLQLQLQRRCGGRLYCTLWNRGRDGSRHGRLSS